LKTALLAAALAVCFPGFAFGGAVAPAEHGRPSRPDSIAPPAPDTSKARIVSSLGHVRITGDLEGRFRWMRRRDAFVGAAGAMTDIYLRRVELGIETSLSGWASAIAVLNSEYIGDPIQEGDERITVDEVHFDLREGDAPLYFVFGKRTLPFGEFENALVNDPMTQDAYEIEKVGATLGIAGPLGLDVSATAYKGTELMEHLFQSALFDTSRVGRLPVETNNVESFIVAASITPVDTLLTIFAAFSSEPGSDRKNLTANGGFNFKLPPLPNLAIDVEYMKALQRERYLLGAVPASRECRESVLAATVSYSLTFKYSALRNRGLYRARRQYRRAHPIEAALRVERFGDDGLTGEFGVYSVRNRYLAGGRYTFLQSGDIQIYLGLEYRRTEFRVPLGQTNRLSPSNDEGYVAFGVDF
jgi:hypothetical protein